MANLNLLAMMHPRLKLLKKDAGFVLTLDPGYGLAGTIEAQKVSIRLSPG
jgi:hypothetical protein